MNVREEQILAYMQQIIEEKGYPPTVREICAALDIRSTSTVHAAMKKLEEEGKIKKAAGKRRALEIVDSEKKHETERSDVVDVPLIGRIAAGAPILAEQNIEDYFPLPAAYASKGTNFMLTVHGESMIGVGINDGDYILVRQQEEAHNGDIVVAMIEDFESEATVKTFYKENGHIRLQPENPTMKPIIVDDVKILGLVKGVFRYFN